MDGKDQISWGNWEMEDCKFVNYLPEMALGGIVLDGHYHITLTEEEVFAREWS